MGHGGRIDIQAALVIFLVSFEFLKVVHIPETAIADITCSCVAHSYVFSFEPNPNWSSFYASSSEIQKYLDGVVNKYSVNRFIKLGHKIYQCRWDEGSSKWYILYSSILLPLLALRALLITPRLIEVEDLVTGKRFTDKADVLINSSGLLNNFKWPDLKGLSTFKGKLVHSAAWDEKYAQTGFGSMKPC